MVVPAEIVAQVRTSLAAVAVPEDAEPMAAYMKNQFPFLGVKTPARRAAVKPLMKAAKEWSNHDLLGVAEALMAEPEREFSFVAADLLRKWARNLTSGDLGSVRALIETKSWWDTVDALAVHVVGPIVRADPSLQVDMDRWIEDDNIWVARTAILHQLMWKDQTDAERLFRYCDLRAADTQFFIRKALGWALRQYARTDPDAVRTYVEANEDRLSGLTKREAMRWIT
ncbi:MAG: DNA alkylation repair protein [Acidimicrobiales bacterium]